MRLSILFLLCLLATPVYGLEIGGVTVDQKITSEDGVVLQLNGAGIRSKFIFDIYLAQLYMENPGKTTTEVLDAEGEKRIVMHFLYDKVEKKKLVGAWNEGFRANSDDATMASLHERIATFNGFFTDVTKGQKVILHFTPATGTEVTIAGGVKGVIEGKDFNDALLRIWLGKKPVTKKLRDKLLGGSK